MKHFSSGFFADSWSPFTPIENSGVACSDLLMLIIIKCFGRRGATFLDWLNLAVGSRKCHGELLMGISFSNNQGSKGKVRPHLLWPGGWSLFLSLSLSIFISNPLSRRIINKNCCFLIVNELMVIYTSFSLFYLTSYWHHRCGWIFRAAA